jgi:hypothetical protein
VIAHGAATCFVLCSLILQFTVEKAMARLKLSTDVEVAFGRVGAPGDAKYTIDPTGVSGKVETWERVITFDSSGSSISIPPYAKVGVFASTTPTSGSVPIGGLYQVLLYEENGRKPDGSGHVLDRRYFPCVLIEGRSNFLTKCTEVPQLDIKAGGTYASIAFASSRMTMSRVQLGIKPPHTGTANLPVFRDEEQMANDISVAAGPKLLHRLSPTDRRMLPGNDAYYAIMVWDLNGNWDYIWCPEAPPSPPKPFKLLSRTVEVQMTRLRYLDDSDRSTNGEGDFTLVVQPGVAGTSLLTKKLIPETFETNTSLTIVPPTTVTVSPAPITPKTYPVSVQVKGHDDDSDSIDDDDDYAETDMVELDLPIGEGKEQVVDRFFSLGSHESGGDDTLAFEADLQYSISYK